LRQVNDRPFNHSVHLSRLGLQRLAMILHHLSILMPTVLIWKTYAQALAPQNHPHQSQFKPPLATGVAWFQRRMAGKPCSF
jgi:hypothetical protein